MQMRSIIWNTLRTTIFIGAAAFVATGCGGDGGDSGGGSGLNGTIRIDGSSTVAPLSEAAAETFQEEESDVRVTVGTSGTGGGFEKFCAGETDISDASREIKDEEAALCTEAGIKYDALQVANDGIALVVNPDNDWVTCLTVDQLKLIWDRDSKVDNWQDVDPKFPDEELELYGPGTDSGTFDFFTKEVNGEEGRSRTDYQPSEDDNVTVQGVAGGKGALGYFGHSYVEQNKDTIKPLEIDGGDGCVEPTNETVQDGTYKPLSRPLYIYPSTKLVARKEGVAFIQHYAENAAAIAEQALFVPLTDEQQQTLDDAVADLKG
ncbi:MAG: phosphate binding protein [Thermoleophilia bacterium]|nr:phosphate binding protein [Thermoleophilia bacterium]